MRCRCLLVAVTVLSLTLATDGGAARRDADRDGMPDRWESRHGLDAHKDDARGDLDGDRLRNLDEYSARTDPRLQDTDADGSDDRDEIKLFQTDPNVADSDSDGLVDGDDDADGDSIADEDQDDAIERCGGHDDIDADTDGVDDEDENDFADDPQVRDSDGDGLVDGNDDANGNGVADEDEDDQSRDFCYFDNGEDFDDIDPPGVMGWALAGPQCPVQKENDPRCEDKPLEGAEIVVRDSDGSEVTRATTKRDGRFAFQLGPGTYTLEPQPFESSYPTPDGSQQVYVYGGELTSQNVFYDTGIR